MRRAWGSAMTVALVLLAGPSAALAQQGSNFNRLNTVRREVTVSPARAGPGQGGGPDRNIDARGIGRRPTSSLHRGNYGRNQQLEIELGLADSSHVPADVRPDADDTAHVLSRNVRRTGAEP